MDGRPITEYTKVTKVAPGLYRGVLEPVAAYAVSPRAYGGCSIGQCIAAACASVETDHRLYTISGIFINGGRFDAKLELEVTTLRSTRTFESRRVDAYQQQDGTRVLIMSALADFHQPESSMFQYNVPPMHQYTLPEDIEPYQKTIQRYADEGSLAKHIPDLYDTVYRLLNCGGMHFLPCPEACTTQNIIGLDHNRPTTQDHLPVYQKTLAGWVKTTNRLESKNDQYATIGFWLDNFTTMLPLHFANKPFDSIATGASCTYSLNFFTQDLRMDDWCLTEQSSPAFRDARTCSEGRLWSRDGRLLASMVQQGLLRSGKRAKL